MTNKLTITDAEFVMIIKAVSKNARRLKQMLADETVNVDPVHRANIAEAQERYARLKGRLLVIRGAAKNK